MWGVSTSAYQVEGAVDEDGRGVSIWDTFSREPGRTRDGDTGDVACDQYHRFEDDVRLMFDLGIGAYRFSVAWPRIQPEGRGRVNQRGLDHYRRLVDALNRHGIVPLPTLYHWDLPQALQDLGGWPERSTADRFAEYVGIVRAGLAGEVRTWITMNEPWVAAWLGYGEGIHAPGERDAARALAASHHLLLGHGLALDAFDANDDVGIALNLEPHAPTNPDDPEDRRLAELADAHMNRQFLDPLFGRGYPGELAQHYRSISDMRFVREGDLETISRPVEFLGLNYYRPQIISSTPDREGVSGRVVGDLGGWYVIRPGSKVTAMDWPVDASALTEILQWVHSEYHPASILVTENGAAFDDVVGHDGAVTDRGRVAYLRDHIAAVCAARAAGMPLGGYFVWSLLDNFEWAEGYSKRFGIVHVDFETQRRRPKASAHWYADLVRAADLRDASGEPTEAS